MKKSVFFVVLLLAAVATWWGWKQFSPPDQELFDSRTDAADMPVPANVSDALVREAPAPSEVVANHPEENGRNTVNEHVLSITVSGPDGRVTDARCVWESLPSPDLTGLYVWGLGQYQADSDAKLTAISDTEGACHFDAQPTGTEQVHSVIWTTAIGFEAGWVIVEPFPSQIPQSIQINLRPHAPLRVRVEDQRGGPISGAQVHLVGLAPAGSPGIELARQAFRAFHTVQLSGTDGETLFSPAPGTHVVWADQSDLASEPMLDVRANGGVVVLRLFPTFLVAGSVAFEGACKYDPALQMTAYAWLAGESVRAGQARVELGGDIKECRLPLFETDGYDFCVRGGDVIPSWQSAALPIPGARVQLKFALRCGERISAIVTDENGQPIPGVRVSADWKADQGGTQIAMTAENGIAQLRGVHPSFCDITATATGFVPARTINIAADSIREVRLTMHRGGKLRGLVHRQGVPASRFSIVWWPEASPADKGEASFTNQIDGTFEVDGLPSGPILLYASSPDCPRSSIKSVRVVANAITDAVLDLEEPITGHGRIVDAYASPVSTATIQIWNSYRAAYLTPVGVPHRTAPDGRFRVDTIPRGESCFVVRAPGFADYLGQINSGANTEIDLGLIGLQRNQAVVVQLESTSAVDFSQFATNADGNQLFPLTPFSKEGVAVWPEAGPGRYFVRVFTPDKTQISVERYLRPGADWRFKIPIDPGCSLDVQATGAESAANPHRAAAARLAYLSEGGQPILHRAAMIDGHSRFETVAGRDVYVELLDETGKRIAGRQLRLNDGPNEVQLGDEGKTLYVRVTNPDGMPLEGATLDARLAAGESPWFQLTSTDASGMHTFTGLGMKRIFINVQHNQYGVRSDVEVDLGAWKSEEVLEIELDPQASVAVRLVDGKTPVPAASVRILAPHSHHILGVFTSDAGGMVRYGPVTRGTYLVSVEQPGIWLTEQLVEAGDKDQPRDVQVRKLGELALRLESESGEAVGGIRVELEAVDGGATLSDWIQRGLVQVGGDHLATDAGGLARAPGIPHGEYLVRLTGTAGSWLAGRVRVQPGPAATNVVLRIP